MDQSLHNKQAEVDFRRKLTKQHRGEACYFSDELNAQEIIDMIEWRMQRTRGMVTEMNLLGIQLNPFLEIGAERCQRSLVFENEYDFRGIAADISLDSLLFAERIAASNNYKKMPLRICCDANKLPIRSSSLPFVFFYQTIHHFSDPSPVIESIKRILEPTGCLYFDEEPVHMRARIPLFHCGNKPKGLAQKVLTKLRLMDFFFSMGRPEVEAGITETDFTLKRWGKIITGFEYGDVVVDSKLVHGKKLARLLHSVGPSRWWVEMMGGNIHGLCYQKQKLTVASEFKAQSPVDILICPECLDKGLENGLKADDHGLCCSCCGSTFPKAYGVYMLFTKHLGFALYPEYFN